MGWQGKKRGWKDFYSVEEYNKAHHDYYYRTNREAFLKWSRNRYRNNQDAYRDSFLKTKFGISLKDYKSLLTAQHKVCAICQGSETQKQYGKVIKLAVDHCHQTKKVRGLLCGACNKGLGYFRDNPERLQNAITYLSKPLGV